MTFFGNPVDSNFELNPEELRDIYWALNDEIRHTAIWRKARIKQLKKLQEKIGILVDKTIASPKVEP